jgi:hypothetical protein
MADPSKFDWVRARSQCSLRPVFENLASTGTERYGIRQQTARGTAVGVNDQPPSAAIVRFAFQPLKSQ